MQLLAQHNAMTSSTPAAAEGAGSPTAAGMTSPQQQQQEAEGAEAPGAPGAAGAATPAGEAQGPCGGGSRQDTQHGINLETRLPVASCPATCLCMCSTDWVHELYRTCVACAHIVL